MDIEETIIDDESSDLKLVVPEVSEETIDQTIINIVSSLTDILEMLFEDASVEERENSVKKLIISMRHVEIMMNEQLRLVEACIMTSETRTAPDFTNEMAGITSAVELIKKRLRNHAQLYDD